MFRSISPNPRVFDPSLVTGLDDLEEIQFRMYPNPSSEKVHLAFQNAYQGQVEIVILDILGKEVARKNFHKLGEDFQQSIPLNLSPNLYLVQMKIGEIVFTRKLRVE